MPSASAVSLTPSSVLSGLPGQTITTGEPGLFSNLLGQLFANGLSTNSNTNGQSPTFGGTGLSLNPTLLVLPQELGHLSAEDLKALLAKSVDSTEGKLDNTLLMSLTSGTPASDALAHFLSTQDNLNQISLDDPTSLTTDTQTAIAANNILLVATGLSPSDMDKLKAALKSVNDKTLAAQAEQDANTKTDALDAENAAIALVMFVPPPTPSSTSTPVNDCANFGFNLNSDSLSLSDFSIIQGSHNTPTNPVQNSGSSGSSGGPDQPPENISSLLFDEKMALNNPASKTDSTGSSGFSGSIASTDAFKAAEKAKTAKTDSADVEAQLPAFSTQLLTASGTPQSHFNDSSLLMTNGAAIATNTSALTNPVTNNPAAYGAHPTVQMVAMMIEKAASGSDKAKQELSVQLDPPELGRLQIQLSYEKGEPMKVHLLAEKQDTLSLLQRDSHALKAALDQAGVQMDGSSLSFDLASGDQSFNQLLGGSQDQNGRRDGSSFSLNGGDSMSIDTSTHIIDTRMDFIPDMATGNIHYSLLV